MFVYSSKIIQFMTEIKSVIKDILSKEAGLKVRGNRFYDKNERASYPIKIVVYNKKKNLGYFNPDFYELGFNERLMHSNKTILHNVIRHELAHYLTFMTFGDQIAIHGSEFRSICEKLGWGKEIFEASILLEDEVLISENPVLRKVQKLMALTTSSSTHEAEQAMLKSRELLLKHNIDETNILDDAEEKVFLKRVLRQRKKNAKLSSIGRILETFFVSTVYHHGIDCVYLEILGDATNIEIAEYVAAILDSELDNLWIKAQKMANLKGLTAKNSFFLGLARGYCEKIGALKKEYNNNAINALIIIEKKLTLAKEMAYDRLSQSSSNGKYCPKSASIGEHAGKNLNINPAVSNSSNGLKKLLS